MTAATTGLADLPQASDDDVRPMVEAELTRIVEHPLFKDTTRMKRFLEYVVKEALDGREDRLKGYSIGVEVFDRPDSFDPQGDTIVRVQAGQLRRRLDIYYSSDGKDSPVRILIPKGRYAPVFELRKDNGLGDVPEAKATITHIAKQNRPGIAVLTFQNLTSENEANYFAEGVTAEIVNALVQFRYIRVVARSANVLDESELSAKLSELAEQYNVQFALAGNVRKAGNLMRVSVNLISVETGEHVYSKIFDRDYTPENLFDIQEEIASYVAANVAAPFGAVNRFNRRLNSGRQSSMVAYEAFLKYYEMNLSPTNSKAETLLEEFEQIVIDTPHYSSAWAIISLLNVVLVAQRIPSRQPEERLKKAMSAAKRAVAIDPENALAFNALFQANYHSGHLDDAEKIASKAILLNPNDYNMLAYYAITRALRGDLETAMAFQNAALELIARPPMWFYTASLLCAFQNQEYEKVLEMLGEVSPSSPVAVQVTALSSMAHLSRFDELARFMKVIEMNNPNYGRDIVETSKHSYLNNALSKQIFAGLRKAGLDIPDM